jgi:hypothetical protein
LIGDNINSLENIEVIIGRAVMEPEFREKLFNDPEAALEGYELNEEEKGALKSLEREKFDEITSELEERISKAGLGFDAGAVGREPLGRLFGDSLSYIKQT